MATPLSELNIESFNDEMSTKQNSGYTGSHMSMMTSRFDDTEIKDSDVVLTTKKCD